MTTTTHEPASDAVETAPPRRRRRRVWAVVAVVAAAAAGTGGWAVIRDQDSATADAAAGPSETAEVSRRTIAQTETWAGTLGRGSPTSVTATARGTVTRVAEPDSTVRRGTELYRLNEHPVVALIGTVPMYRSLAPGAEGSDVRQLERNLSALGYDGFTPDDEFTDYTRLAVQQWQDDLGVDETGTVTPSDIVFVPARGRVGTVAADVGDVAGPGTQILDVTGSDQVVELEADAEDHDLVSVGTDVGVAVPGGDAVSGTVTDSAVVEDTGEDAGAAPGAEDAAAGADETVARAEVTLAEPVDASLIGSPVDVDVVIEQRKNALVVPITALLALAEGGYGVEVVADDGSSSLVPVETGLFADGAVEVRGQGIEPGTVVGVADQ